MAGGAKGTRTKELVLSSGPSVEDVYGAVMRKVGGKRGN